MKKFLVALLFPFCAFADDISEPQITIYHDADGQTFYEYRQQGKLVEIKVQPKKGPAYYLIPDGDESNLRREEKSTLTVPTWVIFSW